MNPLLEKYVLVGFPEVQQFQVHDRWSECIFCIETDENPCEDSTFAIPEDLYAEVVGVQTEEQFRAELKVLLDEAANFIAMATYELGEDFNPNHIDDKLSAIVNMLRFG